MHVPSAITEAFQAQRRFFRTGATLDAAFRQAQLTRLGALLRAREQPILQALREDLGKPSLEAYLSEIHFTLQEIGHALRHLRRWMRPRRVPSGLFNFPARSEIRPEPYGLTLILAPWNYPFQLALGPLVSALAAGNCAILKPSEHAPATSRLLQTLVQEAFDPDLVTLFPGGPEVAASLLDLDFDYVFFTGSTAVGRRVMEACAKHLTPLTLELGGKCPCLVHHQVDLPAAARRIARGKFFNAGQTCVAPDFVCVHESVYEPFLRCLLETLRHFYGDNPLRSPDYGRIINDAHFARLQALLGGRGQSLGTHDPGQRFFAPTVVRDVGWNDPLMREEIFGPILPCLPFSDLDALLDELGSRPKPLALYLFSRDRSFVERCLRAVSSGGVCVNDTLMHLTPLALPFGGVGLSGMGSYHGKAGFDTFSHRRSVMTKSFLLDPFATVPPYGSRLERIKSFLRWSQ